MVASLTCSVFIPKMSGSSILRELRRVPQIWSFARQCPVRHYMSETNAADTVAPEVPAGAIARVELIGRIKNTPWISSSGRLCFHLATKGTKFRDGTVRTVTHFVSVRNKAEYLQELYKQGDRILLNGYLRYIPGSSDRSPFFIVSADSNYKLQNARTNTDLKGNDLEEQTEETETKAELAEETDTEALSEKEKGLGL